MSVCFRWFFEGNEIKNPITFSSSQYDVIELKSNFQMGNGTLMQGSNNIDKLSSGKKINRAADDASGLVVSDKNTVSTADLAALNAMDLICTYRQVPQIVLNDNVVFYQAGRAKFADLNMPPRYICKDGKYIQDRTKHNFPNRYKVFCIDIDGMDRGEAPFAYGIRADGKMVLGCRAQNWYNKAYNKDTVELECNNDIDTEGSGNLELLN